MTRYIDFTLDQGSTIRVEADSAVGSSDVMRGPKRDMQDTIEAAGLSFEQALAKLKPMCSAIIRQVREAAEEPEEVTVDFGVKLSVEAGVILAKSAGEANLGVSITWKKKP